MLIVNFERMICFTELRKIPGKTSRNYLITLQGTSNFFILVLPFNKISFKVKILIR